MEPPNELPELPFGLGGTGYGRAGTEKTTSSSSMPRMSASKPCSGACCKTGRTVRMASATFENEAQFRGKNTALCVWPNALMAPRSGWALSLLFGVWAELKSAGPRGAPNNSIPPELTCVAPSTLPVSGRGKDLALGEVQLQTNTGQLVLQGLAEVRHTVA